MENRPLMPLPWIELARIAAALAVVVLHVSASVVELADFGSASWWWGNAVDSAVRWCVPVFVMISGALLLDARKNEPIATFYRKRAGRVLWPLVFWSLVYVVWNHRHDLAALRPHDFWVAVARGWPHYHLWYLYMLACLYLFVPCLRDVVARRSRPELWWFTGLAFALAMLNDAVRFFNGNQAGLFTNWFLSYLPYFLLGHLLHTSSRKPGTGQALAALLATIVATALGCFWLGSARGPGQGLYVYDYLSITTVPMSLCAMVFFRSLTTPVLPAAWVRAVAPLTLGTYVIHPMYLEWFREHGLQPEHGQTAIAMAALSAAVFAAALATAFAFSRMPLLRRVI